MSYEFLEHTADVKFRADGGSLEEVFIDSASALFETMYGDLEIEEETEKEFVIEGDENINLLYNFLEEFLYLLDAEDFICAGVNGARFEGGKIFVKVVGDKASNYEFTNNVKAITYNGMKIEESSGEWVSEGVFDV